jgi:hypothetical protein
MQSNAETTMLPARPCRRALFGFVPALAALSIPTLAASATGPDAELIRLGLLFDRAAAADKVAWATVAADDAIDDPDPEFVHAVALGEKTLAIIDRIEPLPATTLAGALVKIRAITYLCCADPIDSLVDTHAGWGWKFPKAMTLDVRLLIGLLENLQSMAGVGTTLTAEVV